MIAVYIDELVPCLKNTKTGELVQTEVIKIRRKSFLSKYNEKNGWYVNWGLLANEHEIYALVIEGSVDIQGLVALKADPFSKAVYVAWMCASPESNSLLTSEPKYLGVGGHLFAVAAKVSRDYGYDGFMYGFAMDEKLLDHYSRVFGAYPQRTLHPFHFMIDDKHAKIIEEAYTYEWSDETI